MEARGFRLRAKKTTQACQQQITTTRLNMWELPLGKMSNKTQKRVWYIYAVVDTTHLLNNKNILTYRSTFNNMCRVIFETSQKRWGKY